MTASCLLCMHTTILSVGFCTRVICVCLCSCARVRLFVCVSLRLSTDKHVDVLWMYVSLCGDYFLYPWRRADLATCPCPYILSLLHFRLLCAYTRICARYVCMHVGMNVRRERHRQRHCFGTIGGITRANAFSCPRSPGIDVCRLCSECVVKATKETIPCVLNVDVGAALMLRNYHAH